MYPFTFFLFVLYGFISQSPESSGKLMVFPLHLHTNSIPRVVPIFPLWYKTTRLIISRRKTEQVWIKSDIRSEKILICSAG